MYLAINFNDRKDILVKRVKDEGDIIREKKKYEADYTIRQVANTKSGIIFLANRKPKYIWD